MHVIHLYFTIGLFWALLLLCIGMLDLKNFIDRINSVPYDPRAFFAIVVCFFIILWPVCLYWLIEHFCDREG